MYSMGQEQRCLVTNSLFQFAINMLACMLKNNSNVVCCYSDLSGNVNEALLVPPAVDISLEILPELYCFPTSKKSVQQCTSLMILSLLFRKHVETYEVIINYSHMHQSRNTQIHHCIC